MSRNEDVTTAIWVDLMVLGPEAKLLYLWSFTNEHNGMSGLYKVHMAMMEVETGLPGERLSAALAELEEHRFAFYADGVMLVRSRVRRLRQRTPQIAKAIARDVANVHADHPLRRRFLEFYGGENWLHDALSEAGLLRVKRGSREPQESSNGIKDSPTLTRASSEAPVEGGGVKRTTEDVHLPESFPRELLPHLRIVFKILRDLATRHNARAVSPLSLASVVMARPHKPLVAAAYDYAAWADGQAQRRRDVVGGYRNWLAKTDDLAGFEELRSNGLPGGDVTPRGKESAGSMLRAMGGSS